MNFPWVNLPEFAGCLDGYVNREGDEGAKSDNSCFIRILCNCCKYKVLFRYPIPMLSLNAANSWGEPGILTKIG